MIVRDPVHGDIYLTEHETRVLDTPAMQRLRGIKQTGTSYLVYPGCVHTRFDHALGTLGVVKRMIDTLRKTGFAVSGEDEELTAIAALLHDITHVPFGHTLEDEREIFARHDRAARFAYFLAGELGQALRELGLYEAVVRLLTRKGEPAGKRWRSQIIAGAVDADLLDYLRRDSFFAGLTQNYDDRIFSYFILAEDGQLAVNMVKHGLEYPAARSEILHLLRMRYFLTERVYLHHAKVAAGAMLSKAVELAVGLGLREEDLYPLSDYGFLALLQGMTYGLRNPGIAALVQAVAERRLFKRAYVLSGLSLGGQQAAIIERYAGQSAARQALEERIASAARVPPEQAIVYCPRATNFKEVSVPVLGRTGLHPLSHLEPEPSGEVGALARQYANLWRLYVFVPAPAVEGARQASEKIFDLPSEYTAH